MFFFASFLLSFRLFLAAGAFSLRLALRLASKVPKFPRDERGGRGTVTWISNRKSWNFESLKYPLPRHLRFLGRCRLLARRLRCLVHRLTPQ